MLRDVQHALAREHGHESWTALKRALEAASATSAAPFRPARTADEYERLASDVALAFNSRDEAALHRFNEHYQRPFTFDDLWAEVWRRVWVPPALVSGA